MLACQSLPEYSTPAPRLLLPVPTWHALQTVKLGAASERFYQWTTKKFDI